MSLLHSTASSHDMSFEEYSEYINLPENADKRFELIENQIYMMSSPSSTHSRILTSVSGEIYNYLRGKKCELFVGLDIHLPGAHGKTHVFCPDLFINCDPARITKNFCLGAPEFIIEVASPSTDYRDYGLKRWLYMAFGVEEYWVIDPMAEKVTVFSVIADSSGDIIERHYSFEQPIRIGIFDDLTLNVPRDRRF